MGVDEDDDIEMNTIPLPPPPNAFTCQTVKPKKVIRNEKNVWNGTIHRVINDKNKKLTKAMDLSFRIVGGKEVKLKAIIPKSLQINGRLKFKDVSSCLNDLSKVARSKFTVVLSAKCLTDKYLKEYEQIIEECRSSKRALMIDMKKTKAKIKLILLPTFADNEYFDVDALQKLWKCRLPKSENLWALLTIYNSSDKEKYEKSRHSSRSSGSDRDGRSSKRSDKGDDQCKQTMLE